MAKNRKCGSRAALLDEGDGAKNKKSKCIVGTVYARLVLYIVFVLVGFVFGMFIWQIGLIAALGGIGKILKILLERILRKESKKNLKWEEKFKRKCAYILLGSVIIGTIAGFFGFDERISAAGRAFSDPSVLKEKTETVINEFPTMQEPKQLESEEQKWLKGQPPKVLETINYTLVTQSDYEAASKNNLSQDSSNLIFFLGGRYKIEDWGNEEEILSQVRNLIKDKRGEKNKNVFDQEADEAEKEEINAISEKEQNQIKEGVCISDRLNDVNTRLNYYSIMPKASLALLIGNTYHLFALIAFCYDYPDNAKIYYYAKSIEYGLEYISFEEISDETVKERLIWIAGRYKDIVFTCDGTKEAEWAKLLAKAFECLADEY